MKRKRWPGFGRIARHQLEERYGHVLRTVYLDDTNAVQVNNSPRPFLRMRALRIGFGSLGLALFSICCAQPSTFHIIKGDQVVGQVKVDRHVQGDRTLYSMTSRSKVVVLWPQHIRTAVMTEYRGGRLNACHSAVSVNEEVRDSSCMRMVNGRSQGYIHPGRSVATHNNNPWTTARMYYEEPVGQARIYVESVLSEQPLVCISPGVYELQLPDGDVNRYIYRNGVLHEIIVDRTFFDLVFRRA
jgi:hypothetical protein